MWATTPDGCRATGAIIKDRGFRFAKADGIRWLADGVRGAGQKPTTDRPKGSWRPRRLSNHGYGGTDPSCDAGARDGAKVVSGEHGSRHRQRWPLRYVHRIRWSTLDRRCAWTQRFPHCLDSLTRATLRQPPAAIIVNVVELGRRRNRHGRSYRARWQADFRADTVLLVCGHRAGRVGGHSAPSPASCRYLTEKKRRARPSVGSRAAISPGRTTARQPEHAFASHASIRECHPRSRPGLSIPVALVVVNGLRRTLKHRKRPAMRIESDAFNGNHRVSDGSMPGGSAGAPTEGHRRCSTMAIAAALSPPWGSSPTSSGKTVWHYWAGETTLTQAVVLLARVKLEHVLISAGDGHEGNHAVVQLRGGTIDFHVLHPAGQGSRAAGYSSMTYPTHRLPFESDSKYPYTPDGNRELRTQAFHRNLCPDSSIKQLTTRLRFNFSSSPIRPPALVAKQCRFPAALIEIGSGWVSAHCAE